MKYCIRNMLEKKKKRKKERKICIVSEKNDLLIIKAGFKKTQWA